MRRIRTDKAWYFALACTLCLITPDRAQSPIGTVTDVRQETAEINLGRMDGLQPNTEGTIYFEIRVGGRKKEVPVAAFKVTAAGPNTSQIKILSPTGEVKTGYRARPARLAALTPTYYLARAEEHYQAGEFEKAIPYYQKIVEVIAGDPLAQHRLEECRRQLAEQAARQKELDNVAYYRDALQKSLSEKDQAAAAEYAQRIAAVVPDDAEAREVLARSNLRPALIEVRADPASEPAPPAPETASGPEIAPARTAALPSVPVPPPGESAASPPGPEPGPSPSGPAVDRRRMVFVPGATALIGENGEGAHYLNEQPAHEVTVKPFYMDRYEVTNAEYQRFVTATGHRPPPYWKDGGYPPGTEDYPVVLVTWDDAEAYARWAGKRLPTEAEWELAARGTDRRPWPWGLTAQKVRVNTRQNRRKSADKIGSYPDDRSPYGIFDMGGNVSEWTADWYQPYPGNKTAESDYGEKYKVLRGGSFNSEITYARGAFRAHLKRDYKAADLGFRCAADP